MKTKFLLLALVFLFLGCYDDDIVVVHHQNDGAYINTKYESRTPVHLFNDFEAHTDFSEAWIEPSTWNPEREAFKFYDRNDENFTIDLNYHLPAYWGPLLPFQVGTVIATMQLESRFSNNVVDLDISQEYNYTDLSDIDFILYEEMRPAIIDIKIIDENIIEALFLMRVFDRQLNEHVIVEIDAEFLKVRGRTKPEIED